jgi:hypothetical protein
MAEILHRELSEVKSVKLMQQRTLRTGYTKTRVFNLPVVSKAKVDFGPQWRKMYVNNKRLDFKA